MSRRLINGVARVSKLLQPIKLIPKGSSVKIASGSRSYQLMLDMGIIRQVNSGMYALLPLGSRALDKLVRIVDDEMTNIGAQKIVLPNLTDQKLWHKTGRMLEMGPELFRVKDRHSHGYVLGPTYEEAVTNLIADIKPQQSNLPLLVYQISNKWRDEMRPKLGLFRSREFLMKDLYSFDVSLETAQDTYEVVTEAYNNILSRVGLPYTVAEGDTGVMGGVLSHEYLYNAEVGEDTILSCEKCSFHVNSAVYEKEKCSTCGEPLEKHNAIEIAHTFLLGTKYSEALQATCHLRNAEYPLEMGCYGLGLTRLLAAAVELLSTNEDLRWPRSLAPFTVCVVPPKENSKESPAAHYADDIVEHLVRRNIDVIVDDRTDLTIGRRMLDAKRTGYSYVIVVGKSSMLSNPLFEFYDVNEEQRQDLSMDQLRDIFGNIDVDIGAVSEAAI